MANPILSNVTLSLAKISYFREREGDLRPFRAVAEIRDPSNPLRMTKKKLDSALSVRLKQVSQPL